MRTSVDRILTTHTGGLGKPDHLVPTDMRLNREGADSEHEATDDDNPDAGADAVRRAIAETVQWQVENGVDIVNDGEVSKNGYAFYITSRITGFEDLSRTTNWEDMVPADILEYPDLAARMFSPAMIKLTTNPLCTGPVSYHGQDQVAVDIANLTAATKDAGVTEIFMTAASPGVISLFHPNAYYKTEEEYLGALADAMKVEYDAIHDAGFLLQLDCPDLAMGAHTTGLVSDAEHKKRCAARIEALNHATRDIPSDRLRMHLCWGNYPGPHHHDIAFSTIFDDVMRAKPMAVSFEGANPRHEHEWIMFEDRKLPDDKVLMPGVIDTTTNFIEHPELVAQRIERYARLVGQEHVIASSDCGPGAMGRAIATPKLASMAEGARIASKRLNGQ